MKGKTFILIASVLTLLFLLSGCEFFGNLFTPPYVGTWKGQDTESETWILVTIGKDGSFSQSMSEEEDMDPLAMMMRGTIEIQGKNGTTTFLALRFDWNGNGDIDDDDEWKNIEDLLQQYPTWEIETENSFTYTINGDTMVITEDDGDVLTFTRQ
ncbi:MAG: hypothetical protein JW760_06905 [Spirochaetales bacterium]|nr:hypothetical protein [Spirochaetales bacterium]